MVTTWYNTLIGPIPCVAMLTDRVHTLGHVLCRCFCSVQAVRRILANVHANSQMLRTSPYLDGHLFHYDDNHISAVVWPQVFSNSILRFVSKQH